MAPLPRKSTSKAATMPPTTSPYFSSSRLRRSKRGSSKLQAVATLALAASSIHTTPAAAMVPSSSDKKKRKPTTVTPLKKKQKKQTVERTYSFDALWSGNFDLCQGRIVEPHTLILGTHPGIQSLEKQEYYGDPMNVFWWIAGDALGFRRGTAVSPSTGKPYQFSDALRYDSGKILPYPEQIKVLLDRGFCLWDVVQSCRRPGSLDQDISEEIPNDIAGFCQTHPSIRRIVLANGLGGAKILKKHFATWLSQECCVLDHDLSVRAFSKLPRQGEDTETRIVIMAGISVSPAAAKYNYTEKRDFWEQHVYQEGLAELAKRK